jgi:hypothetical protein
MAVEVKVQLNFGVLWVSKTDTGPGRWCYGSGDGLAKDLGPDSSVFVKSAAGLTYTSKLAASRAIDAHCQLTYKLVAVEGGDWPYEVQVGGRKAGEYSEADLRAGLQLKVG